MPGLEPKTAAVLSYLVGGEGDYGTVQCWGESVVGQGYPCRFYISKDSSNYTALDTCYPTNITQTHAKVGVEIFFLIPFCYATLCLFFILTF